MVKTQNKATIAGVAAISALAFLAGCGQTVGMDFPQTGRQPGKYLTAADAKVAIEELGRAKDRQQPVASPAQGVEKQQ